MLAQDLWGQFLSFMEERCSQAEFDNWFSPIILKEASDDEIHLEVPNIFVQQYLIDNYKKDLTSFLPVRSNGEPALIFSIKAPEKNISIPSVPHQIAHDVSHDLKLNPSYIFENFIEGPANQFVKSAALGVANRPGRSYNPLFIHGSVGLGKTHLLHAIGHTIKQQNKKLNIQYITTEAFINDLVDNLRNKSIDKMKKFYRSLDVLLVDDIQFLQNRTNFEEEFCNTFEALINQNKQIVITSDKTPSQLKLSERIIGRMEWGLVAHVGAPDFETRVAILQHKAQQKGVKISQKILFYIAERLFSNVRQLEGALNRLSAYSRLMGLDINEEIVEKTLNELFQNSSHKKVCVDNILKSVASIYDIKVADLTGSSRSKTIAFPRQVAMYLAKELINDSLMKLALAFGGKTHSTLLHAWKKISSQLEKDESLKHQILKAKNQIDDSKVD
ncbi:MAG: chromosomal replication initiator protein DnaA [Rhabdochlamydiaceae bacterium]